MKKRERSWHYCKIGKATILLLRGVSKNSKKNKQKKNTEMEGQQIKRRGHDEGKKQ